MSPQPFVDSQAELYYCNRCASWQWTDLAHRCDARSGWTLERAFGVAVALGCLAWAAGIVAAWKALR